jgi:two-component system response regulator MprA
LKETILIVDDEPDILETLREAFEYEGYSVEVAQDGADALDRLRALSDPPCAAILDVLMPKLNGISLHEAMKNDPRLSHVFVIFCTSAPSLVPAGSAVMRKPIDLTRLVATVRAHC